MLLVNMDSNSGDRGREVGVVVGVTRRRKTEDIDYRLGRLARKRVEAQVPSPLACKSLNKEEIEGIFQAKAAESLPGPPLKKQGAEISDLMSR